MRASERQDAIRPGQVVAQGRYELLAELGRGGLATVFRAKDNRDGSEVALKVLCDRYVGRPEREERLRREFDYAARVDHPAVIRVKELGALEDGRPYFSMELVAGPPLSSIISGSGGLPFSRTRRLARAIAVALDAVHSAGIVHRDIKPENVLVLDDDHVKLIDFGMAGDDDAPAVPAGHTSRLTRANDLLGTHEYMAPEQVLKATPRRTMDVFALGVVMYEMLSSITPYSGMKVREYVELQIAGDPFVRSADRWARLKGAPAGFGELIDDCRRRDPGERPADMQEIVRRLDALEVVASSPAIVPVASPVVVAVGGELPPVMMRSSSGGMREARRGRVLWVGAAAAGLVMVLGRLFLTDPRAISAAEASPGTVVSEATEAAHGTAAVVTEAVEFRAPVKPPHRPPQAPRASNDDATRGSSSEPSNAREASVTGADLVEVRGPAREMRGGRVPQSSSKATRSTKASPTPAQCERIVDAARTAFANYRWEAVLAHTSEPACWAGRKAEHLAMRTEALMEGRRWTECVRLGQRSTEPRVRRFAERCQKRLDTIAHEP